MDKCPAKVLYYSAQILFFASKKAYPALSFGYPGFFEELKYLTLGQKEVYFSPIDIAIEVVKINHKAHP